MALMGAEWLQTGRNIPAGGTIHHVRYETGTRSSKEHLRDLNSVLTTLLGRTPFKGSLNLRADSPVTFDAPAEFPVADRVWLLVPVVVNGAAVGVAARKPPPVATPFIEVFACDQIAPQLDLKDGDLVGLQILSGEHLGLDDHARSTT
ncbi:hypothetical protein LCGC14_1441980 [marine sediment metagenome]|uniref:Uncharacterized protein n=1 Tax=marine sediment metagenome TaxID=412755 RepID=A0A0F9M0X2_9ZZZZ